MGTVVFYHYLAAEHNKLFKSDSQRVAFLLCVEFSD